MAEDSSASLSTPSPPNLYESRREREFYRYYEPLRALREAEPQYCNLHDAEAVQAHHPSSSPDRALTAFCQLGALRLATRRAMLFFFDRNNVHIFAEATRTLSLQDDSNHEIEDHLWLGQTIIPRGFSVCEHTVHLPANEGSNKDHASSGLVHIVNDLRKDTRFCDRPYVSDGPKARFYAGVPITTPNNINIGVYCVLDDKTRDGLNDKEIHFLRDMAAAVMAHLEMIRAKAEHRRGTLMVSGLSSFVRGTFDLKALEKLADGSSKVQQVAEQARQQQAEVTRQAAHKKLSGERSAPKHARRPVHQRMPSRQPSGISEIDNYGAERPPISVHSGDIANDSATDGASTDSEAASTEISGKATQRADYAEQESVASDVRATFRRAAHLVREAVGVDGALFLDASIATFGGLVDPEMSIKFNSDSVSLSNDANSTESDERSMHSDDAEYIQQKPCIILGESYVDTHSMKNYTRIKEAYLRSLLRRYPNGKIWNFNEDGYASDDDEYHRCGAGSKAENPSVAKRRRRTRLDDNRVMQRLFPGVRSLVFVGMWNPSRGRWFAGCVLWTFSPTRILTQDGDIGYLSAFCNVVMAEINRLEAQRSERAKSDFISSVSHELRSPLHGILGSVECLQDQPGDAFSLGLVAHVETCGRTLLDIIDHLLDFSKINHFAHHYKVKESESHRKRRRVSFTAKKAQLGGMMSLDADVSLDQITEEVIETAVYSFVCSRSKQALNDRKVTVVLDIDRSTETSWKCRLASGGWKRICINLVSNALKYTNEGYVLVSLKATPSARSHVCFNAVLTVTDSGRGMSKDFLQHHLFEAFSQEDNLAEGTGLGMSMISKIVKAFGGQIEVSSERGVGTSVVLTIPLEHSRESSEPSSLSPPILCLLPGLSIGIVGPSESQTLDSGSQTSVDTGRSLLLTSVQKTCTQLGLHAQRVDWRGLADADLHSITETELGELLSRRPTLQWMSYDTAIINKPLLVICDTAFSERQMRATSAGSMLGSPVEYIAQPCGPDRLTKAIQACLEASAARHVQGSLVPHGAAVGEARGFGLHPLHPAGSMTSLTPSPPEPESVPSPRGCSDSCMEPYSPNHPTPPKAMTPAPPPVDRESQSSTSDAKPRNSLSLLLVDDNHINLQLLVTYAARYGHRQAVATDGQQAVDAYRASCSTLTATCDRHDASGRVRMMSDHVVERPEKPQVILMDINMPVLDGFAATRQIRAFEQQHGLEPATVIALTGLGSLDAQREAYSSGVNMFLTKPVRLKELTQILDGIRRG